MAPPPPHLMDHQAPAWHVLSLLLRLGRPARPSELRFSGTIFFDMDLDYLRYLCSIPGSPIHFSPTHELSVSPSLVSLVSMRRLCRMYERRSIIRELTESQEPISTLGGASDCAQALLPGEDYMDTIVGSQLGLLNPETNNLFKMVARDPCSFSCNARQLCYRTNNVADKGIKETGVLDCMMEYQHACSSGYTYGFLDLRSPLYIPDPMAVYNCLKVHMPCIEQFMRTTPVQESITWRETKMSDMSSEPRGRFNDIALVEMEEESTVPPLEAENVCHNCQPSRILKDETADNFTERPLLRNLRHEGDTKYFGPAVDTDEVVFLDDTNRMNLVVDLSPSKSGGVATARVESKDRLSIFNLSSHQNQTLIPSAETKTSTKALNLKNQMHYEIVDINMKYMSPSGGKKRPRDKSTSFTKQKVKQKHEESMPSKKRWDNYIEKGETPIATAQNSQKEPKPLPNFQAYTVEEEEGSGGYGTVYRARRKSDGLTFAIKCPHENANSQHVYNELKMLERFGGKNYVIKYEGSIKSGSSECLVLEHVEHDRPEILKREIDVSELLWYGYCMFRALAGLHKQGIVHRDVKPGNFLFSRHINKGYLIDFNLALDLHQKYGTSDKLKMGYDVSSNHLPPVHTKTLPLANKNLLLESTNKDSGKGSKPLLLPNNQIKKDAGSKNAFSGQGADGSGITSAKDATSAKTTSRERLKKPFICLSSRKELNNLAHESLQIANYSAQSIPSSKRKRVLALPGKGDKKLLRLTPMPISSNGTAVAGAGRIKDEGDKKQKREGPCAGTKGFRAPEVLFRSAYQGPKIDIWSAGVTLLYLMIGRTPFTGEPEQNIKDIAKLRGSEDLWEVAKLHNRISSFPQDLHDVQFLSSVKLPEWCKQNTRRPEFFKEIPKSLFDLVDKCLTVNPRLRLTADEALRHEFFTPCHEDLRKVRLRRTELSSNSGNSHLLQKDSKTLECVS